MTPSETWDLDGLTSPDRLQFERTLAAVVRNRTGTPAPITEAAIAIARAAALGHRERDRRLQVLLADQYSVAEILKLVEEVRLVAPGAVNALMTLVPPDQRVGAQMLADRAAPGPGTEQASLSATPSSREVDPLRNNGPSDDSAVPTVVLLGTEAEHDRSMRVLQNWGFHCQRHEGAVELQHVVGPDVCGLLVGKTWWQMIPEAQHQQRMDDLILGSTFRFLRISTDGLAAPVRTGLMRRYEELIGRQSDGSTFCHGVVCDLDDADQGPLAGVSDLLRNGELTRFHPRGMEEAGATLLRLLAAGAGRRRHRTAAVQVSRLTTGLLPGGKSSAQVAFIEPDDGGMPMVVKLDDLDRLRAERERYDQWIRPWDNGDADAQLHCHGGAWGLVYRVVGRAEDPTKPAPTLEDRIRDLVTKEMWALSSCDFTGPARDLSTTVELAVTALERLNRRRSGTTSVPEFWRHWSMRNLWTGGIEYRLRRADGAVLDLSSVIEGAVDRVARLDGQAVVHGDIQLRNVLIRDRHPAFIDFEFSGPGHPCLDLASLDTAVTLDAFRMLADEDELVALFRDVFVDGLDLNVVSSRHGRLIACAGNRLSIETAVRSRQAAINIAQAYGGGIEDYLAIKLVLCCFGLAQLAPQSGAMRACIRALVTA